MDRRLLVELLESHRAGALSTVEVLGRLRDWPSRDLGEMALDTHRVLRTGIPEVIFGGGKTPAQVLAAAQALADGGQEVLATRLGDGALEALRGAFGEALRVDSVARAAYLLSGRPREEPPGMVLVLAAGTSDLPVAREAAFVAAALGCRVETAWDVGVAGIHRLLAHRERLAEAAVVVAVAGMDGALPGVVAGLTRAPVIGVPASVGYGAGAGGIAPLLTMLNACAPGVTVVNIDNGFGAACAAWKMLGATKGPVTGDPPPTAGEVAPKA
ncbi:MAG: nickel pincer cofactor biosynthesis protein LarB, partial [Deltaproteobacteria bacterium]|nr:nickel pincer cofactor biosynthesis protein LarB [Deltaproteobacteria bacterium]